MIMAAVGGSGNKGKGRTWAPRGRGLCWWQLHVGHLKCAPAGKLRVSQEQADGPAGRRARAGRRRVCAQGHAGGGSAARRCPADFLKSPHLVLKNISLAHHSAPAAPASPASLGPSYFVLVSCTGAEGSGVKGPPRGREVPGRAPRPQSRWRPPPLQRADGRGPGPSSRRLLVRAGHIVF